MTLLPVLLPEGYTPKVSVNDKLTAGQIIAEKKEKGIEEVIHIFQILRVSPKKVTKFLRKSLGDSVSIGDVLAIKRGRLRLGTKKIISEFSGTIVKIDEEKGDVLIHTGSGERNLISIVSPVDGIVDFCNNNKIVIKTDRQVLLAKKVAGEEASGELFVIDGEEIDFNKITADVSKKIVLGKNFTRGSIFKVFALGALGVVSAQIDESDFEDLEEKGIKSPVVQIEEGDFDKLIRHNKKQVYLDPKNKSLVVL